MQRTNIYSLAFLKFGTFLFFGLLPLYQPIRYQFGLENEFPIFLFLLLIALLATVVVRRYLCLDAGILPTNLDTVVTFFFLYECALLLVFAPWEWFEFLELMRKTVGPVGIFFIVSKYFSSRDIRILFSVILWSMLSMTVLYLWEAYTVNILRGPFMLWTERYLSSFIAKRGLRLYDTYVRFGPFIFFRLHGFCGYVHASAYGMSIVGLGFLSRAMIEKKLRITHSLAALLGILGMLVSLTRTVIVSSIIGLVVLLWVALLSRLASIQRKILFTLIIFIAAIIAFLYAKSLTKSSILLTTEGLIKHTNVIIALPEITGLIQQISSYPLSLITGVGFSEIQTVSPVLSNDLFLIYWLSSYGLIGSAMLFLCIFLACKFLYNLHNLTHERIFPVLIVLTLVLTMLHSAILTKLQYFPMFFAALGAISAIQRRQGQAGMKLTSGTTSCLKKEGR